MAVRLVVTFQAKTGMAADFASAFAPQIAETLKEPGCEQYELFRSQSAPDKLVLLERWTSAQDLEVTWACCALAVPHPPLPSGQKAGRLAWSATRYEAGRPRFSRQVGRNPVAARDFVQAGEGACFDHVLTGEHVLRVLRAPPARYDPPRPASQSWFC